MSDTTRSNMVMHQTDVRPWGEYEVVLDAPDVKIKLIEVFPGQRMSYQYHEQRAEVWTVIHGTLTIVLNGEKLYRGPGQSIRIPLGAKHRAWNETDLPVHFVEVQTGTYFGEDDIIRIEDDYNRE
jgi:mannose-6-phosphate isomerase